MLTVGFRGQEELAGLAPLPGPHGAGPGASCSPRGVASAGMARQSCRGSRGPCLSCRSCGPCGALRSTGMECWPRPSLPVPASQGRAPAAPVGAPLPPLRGLSHWTPASDVGKYFWSPWARRPALHREVTLAAFMMGPPGHPSPRQTARCSGLCEKTPRLPLQRGGPHLPPSPRPPCSTGPGPRPGHAPR